MSMPQRRTLPAHAMLVAAGVVVAALVVASMLIGAYDLTSDDFGSDIFWISRVPRTAALVLAGCAMSVSGLVMQLLTQNRFVEPTTTGTAEWAALGLLVVTIAMPQAGLLTKMVGASLMALFGTLIFLGILSRIQIKDSLIVPLIGIMLGAVVAALTTQVAVVTNNLQMLGTWFVGSFTHVVRGRYEVLWVVAIVVILTYIAADRFTVAGLGRDTATSVGLNYERVMFIGTALVAVATGVTTVAVGFLPFLGLIVPNIVTLIRGDNLRTNIVWVCLGGVAIVTVCDIIGRVIVAPFEMPVSVILGFIGAIVFIALLLRQRPA